jgi:hypothetical protein
MTLASTLTVSPRARDLIRDIKRARMDIAAVEKRITNHIERGEDLQAVNLEDEVIALQATIESLQRRLERETAL